MSAFPLDVRATAPPRRNGLLSFWAMPLVRASPPSHFSKARRYAKYRKFFTRKFGLPSRSTEGMELDKGNLARKS